MARPVDLVQAIRAADERHGLLRDDARVVVGVSGGPDSVALAHSLAAYASERRLSVHLAHLDHGLRKDSANDAALVAGLAESLGLPLARGRVSVRVDAGPDGRGVEDAARSARYAWLTRTAIELDAEFVAVGHTADDQAETVMLHIARGCGLEGLRGMARRGPMPLAVEATESVPTGRAPELVRPLLGVWRSDVERYLERHGLPSLQDPTNVDRRWRRNRIRHEVIPALELVNPGCKTALLRLAELIEGDLEVLEAAVDEAWGRTVTPDPGAGVRLAGAGLRDAPIGVQRRLLRRAVAAVRGGTRDLEWVHVEAARRLAHEGRSGQRISLPRGLEAARVGPDVEVRRAGQGARSGRLERVALAVPGVTDLSDGWSIVSRPRPRALEDAPRGEPWRVWLAVERLSGRLRVRSREPGDRLAPLGMAGRHKSLQDVFVDGKVPRDQRDGWPVVEDEEGIVWLPGFRAEHRAAAREGDSEVIELVALPPETVAAIP